MTLVLLPLVLLLLLGPKATQAADDSLKTASQRNIDSIYDWLPLFSYMVLASGLMYINLQGPSFRLDSWTGRVKELPSRFPSVSGHESRENINRAPLFSRNQAMLLSLAIILAVPFFPNPANLFTSDVDLVYNRVFGWFFWVNGVWALSKVPFLFARAPIQIAPLLHTFSPIWSPRFTFLLPHILYGVVMLVLISAVFFDFSLLEASWVRYTWLPATAFNVALVWPVRNNIGALPEKAARIVNITTCVLTLVGAFLLTVLLDQLSGAGRKAAFIFFVIVTFSGPIGEIRKWLQVFVLRFITKVDTYERPLQWISTVENAHGPPKTHAQERRTRFIVRFLVAVVTLIYFASISNLFSVGTGVGEQTATDYSECRASTIVHDSGDWRDSWFGPRASSKSLDAPWFDEDSSWNQGTFRLKYFTIAFLAIATTVLAAQLWTAWWRFGFFGAYRNALTSSLVLWSLTTVVAMYSVTMMGGRRITFWIGAIHNLAEVLVVYSLLFGDARPGEPRARVFGGRALVPAGWRYFTAFLFLYWFVEAAFVSLLEDLGAITRIMPSWGAAIDLLLLCTALYMWQVRPFWLPPRPVSTYRWLFVAFALHMVYVSLTLANCALGPPIGRVVGVLPLNTLALIAIFMLLRDHLLPAEASHASDSAAYLERLSEDPNVMPRVQEIDADVIRPGMQLSELDLMPLDLRAFLPKTGTDSVVRLEDADAVASAAAAAAVADWTDDEQDDAASSAPLAPAAGAAAGDVELAETRTAA